MKQTTLDKEILKKNLLLLSSTNKAIIEKLTSNITNIEKNVKIFSDSDNGELNLLYKGNIIKNLEKLSQEKLNNLDENIGIVSLGEVLENIPTNLVEIYNDLKVEKIETIPKIQNLFILGTLPFFHIKPLVENINDLRNIIIYEPNIEFLYIFLSIVDLEEFIVNRKITIHFALSKESLNKFLMLFINAFAISAYIKSYESNEMKEAENELFKIYKFSNTTISFESALNRVKFFEKNISLDNSYFILNLEEKLKSMLKDIPVFIVGSGPSLDKSINILKKANQKAVIVSLTTAIRTLYKNNIKPDFISIADSQSNMIRFLEGIDKNFLKSVDCLSHIYVETDFVKQFNRNLIYLYSLFRYLLSIRDKINVDFDRGATVLNSTFDFLFKIGFRKFYLLGIDLGTKYRDRFHTDGYGKNYDDVSKLIIKLEGNFGGEVFTKPDYYTSKIMFEEQLQFAKGLDKKLKVYNLSDGAKILHTTPLKEDELTLKKKINKKDVIKKIRSLFKKENVKILPEEKKYVKQVIIPYIKSTVELLKAENNPKKVEEILDNFLEWIIYKRHYTDILFNNEISGNIRIFLKILKLSNEQKRKHIVEKHKEFIVESVNKILKIANLLS